MPVAQKVQKEQYRTLIKKYNICFDGPVDQDEWPASHRRTFDNIRKLGRMEVPQYRESISADSEFYPWREPTRRRASRIAGLAKLCRGGRRNESGWRLLLESEILFRFTIEVACRKCRARLWRSELEAALSAESEFAEALGERQKRREPCSCKPIRWNEEPHEQGINRLFDDRAEETVIHDEEVLNDLPKKEIPDRVYGLRMTKRLERLILWSEDKRPSSGGRTIGECIRTSPLNADGGEPVVFPFLVIEAKSEKGRDSFSDIEVQTAFSIRTLLKLQQDLRDAAGYDSESEASPLVWFFSYKGEQWRVSAAFVRNGRTIRSYRIVDLWEGRISWEEGALQLLLIIDYIFDWARDIYRETIVSELRSLSASDTQSLTNDSDIYSKLDHISFFENETGDKGKKPENESSNATEELVEDSLCSLDSASVAFRDARYIKSRFMSLFITEDNLSELTQSMKSEEKALSAIRTILQCLKDSWRVDAEALDQLEVMWTGKDRDNSNLYSPTKPFLIVLTATAYLSPSWIQTREISCLAVSADVVESLVRRANQKIDDNWDFSHLPYIGTDVFVGFMRAFQSISVEDNLLASISRACVTTKLFSRGARKKRNPDYPSGSVSWITSIEKLNDGLRYRFDAAVVPDNRAQAREFISSIYNLHKIGRHEPSSSILRLSARLDLQDPDEKTMPTLWTTTDFGDASQEKIFAVTSKNPSNISEYPEFCLFITEPADALNSAGLAKDLTKRTLQTRRLDSKPGWGRGWNNADVKAEDTNTQQRLSELLEHIRSIISRPQRAKSRNSEEIWEQVWGPRSTNGSWDMFASAPVGLMELLDFVHKQGSKGRKVDSITVRATDALPFRRAAKGREPNLIVPAESDEAPDGVPGPSGTRRDVHGSVIPSDDDDDADDDIDLLFSLPSKRAREVIHIDDDSDEEASSPGPSHKRQRTDNNAALNRDYLDEDEIELLLEQGYFD